MKRSLRSREWQAVSFGKGEVSSGTDKMLEQDLVFLTEWGKTLKFQL